MTFIPGTHKAATCGRKDLSDHDDLMELWPELVYSSRVTLPLRAGDCMLHNGLCAHMANSNDTDEPRVAHIIIYMDAETVYTGASMSTIRSAWLRASGSATATCFPPLARLVSQRR